MSKRNVAPSFYESAIEALVLDGQIIVDISNPLFKFNSFRSAFYRYRDTEMGTLMVAGREFKSTVDLESNTYNLSLVEPKKFTLEFKSS